MKTIFSILILAVAIVANGQTTNAPGIRPPTGFTPTTNAPSTNRPGPVPVVPPQNVTIDPTNKTVTQAGFWSANAESYIAELKSRNAFLNRTNNLSDLPNKSAASQYVGVLDINTDSGLSVPEYGYTNATPKFPNQIGIAGNSATVAYYVSRSTTKGDWKAGGMFNGPIQIGSQYWTPGITNTSIALNVWANGNTNLIGTNGFANSAEITALLQQPDPRQGAYICFNAPSGWNGATKQPVMGSPVDFAIGLGGYLYGTNTLGGIAIDRDAIIALNPPVDLFFTTTVNAAPYGCRPFLSYDNLNGVWHFPVDRSGNGAPGNPGYQDCLTVDTKNKTIISTNANVTFSGSVINLGPSGSIQIGGLNNVQIGAVSGVENNGKMSGANYSLNTAGTLLAPSVVNRAGGFYQYINFDASGHTQIGKYVDGSSTKDVYLHFDSDHSHGWLNQPMKVGTNSAPASCAMLEIQSTAKGLLLPRMTKTQRDAIPSPVAGLAVYQTDNTPGLRVYNGTNWMKYTETAD